MPPQCSRLAPPGRLTAPAGAGDHEGETMPPNDQKRAREEADGRERDARANSWIGRWLLQALGTPAGLFQVQVRPLWDRHYRVNVLVGESAASARVADSFFLQADQEGQVVSSTPEVVKRYGPGGSEVAVSRGR